MSQLSSAITTEPTATHNRSAQPGLSVGQVFENFPLTREHLKSCLGLFFVFAIEAWEMMIIVYTALLIGKDFQLDALATGNLIGAIFVGMLIGSLVWGRLSERLGRKRSIILSMVMYGAISLLSAFAPNYPVFYLLRLLSGVAAVGMLVVTFAHFEELLPVKVRGACTVYLTSGWPVGVLLALGATVWLMPLGWRTIIAVSSLGSLWAIAVAYWVPESPYWLASVGRQAEARAVIARLSRGAVQLPSGYELRVEKTLRGTHRELFSAGMGKTSLLQIAVNFTFSWGYWGLQTWLPTLLQQRGLSLPQSYGFIAFSALCMIPGYMMASYLTSRLGRKKVVVSFIGAAVLAGYGFANAQTLETLYLSNFALAFFSMGAWGVWDTWVGELYPTRLRVLGYSWAVFSQRVANILAPSLIGVLVAFGTSFNMTTTLINGFMLASVLLALLIPETEGERLH
ncbi:MFS transporter [Pseudomonas aeruginosa]|uniref:MFS transporter n=1 Tax=Pseudomonas TaxID=286 RepID=UPI00053433FE|nr:MULTISPECIES: MFS transporter [Pseudomonas]MBA1318961.1 MFS transporter [Pseudomonas monteilii]ASD11952.1 MFS transporter [Pseudomonas aeruginosa]AVZ34126.1 MFS transporter [Pseudomonas aeruginosa]KRV19593.1 MFS transporter [Pseudomonas aeruginosa]KSR16285.1 MFS transporter [Pseudomonas aeruginosa]